MTRLNISRGLALVVGVSLALGLVSTPAVAHGSGPFAKPKTTFGNGTWRVGVQIAPGTYRTRKAKNNCYWVRLSGFSGSFDDIIANDFASGYMVVTIAAGDVGFKSSRCAKWTSNLSRVTKSMTSFGQGTFIVGVDMLPGTYQSSSGSGCYWQRMSSFTGTFDDIIANDFVDSGPVVVAIDPTDVGFKSSRCGTWTLI